MTTEPSITERDFRDAMGSFATGVCVLGAVRADGQAIGMTVNSFSSVSLDPPLVLVCLGLGAARVKSLVDAGRFAISVLSSGQESLSNHFAQGGEGAVPDAGWAPGDNGAPLMEGAAAHIECDIEVTYPGGDHLIVVGRVTRLYSDPGKAPLIYFRGGYRALSGPTA